MLAGAFAQLPVHELGTRPRSRFSACFGEGELRPMEGDVAR